MVWTKYNDGKEAFHTSHGELRSKYDRVILKYRDGSTRVLSMSDFLTVRSGIKRNLYNKGLVKAKLKRPPGGIYKAILVVVDAIAYLWSKWVQLIRWVFFIERFQRKKKKREIDELIENSYLVSKKKPRSYEGRNYFLYSKRGEKEVRSKIDKEQYDYLQMLGVKATDY